MDASGWLSIVREQPASGAEVLQLASRAWPPGERDGQLAAVSQHAAQFVLLAARRDARLVGAILGQQLVGRAAVVWPPQVIAADRIEAGVLLIHAMHGQLARAGVELVQSLLETASGEPAELLRQAGYAHAGDLLYMAADAKSFPTRAPALPVQLDSYSADNHARLVAVVEASYQGSLDCPLVDGLRRTEDVLAGYQAVGQFRPDSWLIARSLSEGEVTRRVSERHDIACLLLADHPEQDQLELIYLGVVPAARGEGLGRALTRHTLWLAQECGRARVVLAVDAANRPAIDGYLVAGFAAWDRRSVFVRSLRSLEVATT
jgi:ribosomal protein S18 acetylase RimI-like enzyme